MVILRPLLKGIAMNKIFREYKAWALITGAASGMGRVYARRLAVMGYNLVLVDINGKGLGETEDLVRKEVAGSAKVPVPYKDAFNVLGVVQDLSRQDAADMVFMQTEEAGCEVEVLVNNAGIMA